MRTLVNLATEYGGSVFYFEENLNFDRGKVLIFKRLEG